MFSSTIKDQNPVFSDINFELSPANAFTLVHFSLVKSLDSVAKEDKPVTSFHNDSYNFKGQMQKLYSDLVFHKFLVFGQDNNNWYERYFL